MLCFCGCGKETTIAPKTITKRGVIKGQPNRYVAGHYCAKREGRRRGTTALYEVDPDTGCWNWLLFKNSKGYGMWRSETESSSRLAHRNFYELKHKISLVAELTLDHLCNNTSCVNPDHMEPTSFEENTRRKNGVFDQCLSLNFIVIRARNEWKKFCRSLKLQTISPTPVTSVAA